MALNHIVIHLDPADRAKNTVTVDGVPLYCQSIKFEAVAKRHAFVTIELLASVDADAGAPSECVFTAPLNPGEQEGE